MTQRGRSPSLEWMAFSHFGSDPPHWNSKSKHPRHCWSKKGWNSAPYKELNFEKQANPLVIKGLWKCGQSHKACIIKSLAHKMLPYGQITSKQGLGSYQNQSADEMQQKRPKKVPKASFADHDKISCYLVFEGIWDPPEQVLPSTSKNYSISKQPRNANHQTMHVSCLALKSAKQGQICSCLEE